MCFFFATDFLLPKLFKSAIDLTSEREKGGVGVFLCSQSVGVECSQRIHPLRQFWSYQSSLMSESTLQNKRL